MSDITKQDLKNTLLDILTYIGADTKYADYAQVQDYLRCLVNKAKR